MQDVRVDLTGVADLDPSVGTKIHFPTQKPNLPAAESVLEAGLKVYSGTKLPNAGVVKDFLDFKSSPNLRVNIIGALKRATVMASTHFTIAFGPSASAGAIVMVGLSAGIYGSNKPEIGVFGSFNYGAVTNATASFVHQGMILFGIPSVVLAGETVCVGVHVGGKVLTGGGFLVFDDNKAHPKLIGFGFEFGVGASVMPFDFTMTKSHTAILGTP
ncbi:MAG TPA: hypothetical protein VJZ26_05785 [Blastocatellia bacterium]|nr:hypothetical protein [Blastocatellia bacterium]